MSKMNSTTASTTDNALFNTDLFKVDASTRVALYIAPVWFALLTIGYRLYAVKPAPHQSLTQAQQVA